MKSIEVSELKDCCSMNNAKFVPAVGLVCLGCEQILLTRMEMFVLGIHISHINEEEIKV